MQFQELIANANSVASFRYNNYNIIQYWFLMIFLIFADIESVVVHVAEKKVILACKSMAECSSSAAPAKASRVALFSFHIWVCMFFMCGFWVLIALLLCEKPVKLIIKKISFWNNLFWLISCCRTYFADSVDMQQNVILQIIA